MNDLPLSDMRKTSAPTKGHGELILLVDSEPSVLDMAKIVFSLAGYKVITTGNSMQAFEIYEKRSGSIAVVLLDLAMPIMDGVALTHILVDINPEVKIIVASREDTPKKELELRKLGVKDFLSKPYNVTELLRVIYQAIHPEAAAAV